MLAIMLPPANLLAAEFEIRQVADPRMLNREPVLSDTGLAAWHSYEQTEDNIGKDIYVFEGETNRNLTRGVMEAYSANFRPVLQGNSLVWTTTYTNPVAATAINWDLREVPDRDSLQPGLDIEGSWVVISGGSRDQEPEVQQLVKASSIVRTNLVPVTGTDTNLVDGTNAVTQPPPAPVDTNTTSALPSRHPSGNSEICFWTPTDQVTRITIDYRNDLAPSVDGRVVAWQKAKGWPFGWEIMAWNNGTMYQLTTNFYYDMAPKVQGGKIAWYGWDGHDFEVFVHDAVNGGTAQITSNQYDDVSPVLWEGMVAWEAYPAVEADVYLWRDNRVQKLSDNIEDDINPRIWNGQVVWQGFDGDDFEIYYYNGTNTVKLTSNLHDDVNPDIGPGLVCWMGYHDNWDPEIYVWDGKEISRLTDNEFEDRDPRTAGGRVIWQTDEEDNSFIYLATPK